jgi:two-component system OmpR family response regulator
VDWQLPDGSGLQWLRDQRCATGERTPALMLTARDAWPTACWAWTAAPTTTWSSPLTPKSWWRGCGCAGAARAPALDLRITLGDVEIDLAAHSAWRGRRRGGADGARMGAGAGPAAARRPRRATADLERLVLGVTPT